VNRIIDLAESNQGEILRSMMRTAGVSSAGLCEHTGWEDRFLRRRLSGETNLRIADIAEAAQALGLNVTLTISRRAP
jgi:hypothetical protein